MNRENLEATAVAVARSKPLTRDRIFEVLERLDSACHRHGLPAPLCRIVGRMEVGYYTRATDWENPLYVKPGSELWPRFADRLCAHGYRVECPKGCENAARETGEATSPIKEKAS